MTPHLCICCFSVVPPNKSVLLVSHTWRAFWAHMAPLMGPQSNLGLLRNLKRYKDIIWCVALGTEVPGHCWTEANLNCLIVKKTNRIEFVAGPFQPGRRPPRARRCDAYGHDGQDSSRWKKSSDKSRIRKSLHPDAVPVSPHPPIFPFNIFHSYYGIFVSSETNLTKPSVILVVPCYTKLLVNKRNCFISQPTYHWSKMILIQNRAIS